MAVGIAATVASAVGIYMYTNGYWLELWNMARPVIISTYKAIQAYLTHSEPTQEIKTPYEWSPGKEVDTGKFIVTDLDEMGSFGVYAMTGSGKTSFIHSFLYQLFTTTSPNDIQFVIADLKDGLDFRIFRRLMHLALPVAETTKEAEKQIIWLLQEKERRSKLFKAIPENKLCNNLHKYHELGASLNLPRLPRIV
ncbi:hypothetical protein KC887_10335, partial [Candidatus Kaiserbacteria bacterium]|nr:hypothetical protein [Candidatus Kaiserbacteria bacterium]